ncbi:acyl-CoA dehydrogenase [Leptothermofonsia sichuanensis E412]|uniref:acyl-CoA dehydrogenase n=1 Tax=Leptothermofonsia sichuanensis TaxID=2917832 RepID=UPI001CA74BB5|nr:acyl-CoA dehydrogenase [Leptothermofonsia sichuanensis]QZZ23069.1 acyl-CoA dehydrogenase [Leptothermofonsia sichuanensis E412]
MVYIPWTIAIPSSILCWLLLGYLGAPLWLWSLSVAVSLGLFQPPIWVWVIFGFIAAILNLPMLRQRMITAPLMQGIRALNLLPTISDTEKAAIEAGTVWIDGEFFSGSPNFQRINQEPYPAIAPEIQAFLDGPVEQVCRMATDWEIHRRKDLPPEVWDYLKQEGFFGMMIPKEYGGLGFSNLAYSSVMVKLASRSFTHTATVGVTNSLGPAKLLLNYGTQAQKDYYLPRLARGEEIPCFALTEPHAGSDAASITSEGVVFKGEDDRLYLRLNFRKRYITLGAIATLIGLAFKLRDPENLLGHGETVGITCALVPADTPGVILGKRHDPMGVPFYNSPIEGRDVVISVDQIIGGAEQAGNGWKMLMQTLAAGRGISFPATCTGVAKLVARVTGAHAVVRRQFGLSIGRFEGIEEPLARIGGLTYLLDAARIYTCGAVDHGEKPSVISAIAKYEFTELARQMINDGMDIVGGAGICRGPRNLLANIYTAIPIPVTVEGANILTRTMMIFGQGAIRCHPYVYLEVEALRQSNVSAFDHAFWHHLGLTVRNSLRSALFSLSRGYLAQSPVAGPTAPYYRKLTWASATFATLTDLALIGFGGSLKRREKLTGRFADVLSWMYLATATLRRFEAEGRKPDDLPLVDWAMQYALAQIQQAFEGIFSNFTLPVVGAILRGPVLAWWRLNPIGVMPDDELGSQVAQQLQTVGEGRDRLTTGIYIPSHPDEALGRLEQAFQRSLQAEAIFKTIKAASRAGTLPQGKPENLVDAAVAAGVITQESVDLLREAEIARNEAIQVDAFTLEEYQQGSQPTPHPGEALKPSRKSLSVS